MFRNMEQTPSIRKEDRYPLYDREKQDKKESQQESQSKFFNLVEVIHESL